MLVTILFSFFLTKLVTIHCLLILSSSLFFFLQELFISIYIRLFILFMLIKKMIVLIHICIICI